MNKRVELAKDLYVSWLSSATNMDALSEERRKAIYEFVRDEALLAARVFYKDE